MTDSLPGTPLRGATPTGAYQAPDGGSGSGSGHRHRIPINLTRRKYSRSYGVMVGSLKLILPTVALSLLALAAVWPLIEGEDQAVVSALSQADRLAADKIQVSRASYTGTESNGQPFTVTADLMEQESPDSKIVLLTKPQADILLTDNRWGAVTAKSGSFNQQSQILKLVGKVNLFHDMGYEFRTETATLDLTKGSAKGTDPVEGQGPFGYVEAEGFQVENRGERVELSGKSKLVIYQDDQDTTQ